MKKTKEYKELIATEITIKNTLSTLTEEQELKVLESNIDLNLSVDKKTTDRIKKKVYEKSAFSPAVRKKTGKDLNKTAIYAAAIITAIALTVTAICAAEQPLRDRIIKVFSKDSAITEAPETERLYPYQSSPVYESVIYPVAEVLDFSDTDYTAVDKIVVRSGLNGTYMTFTDTEELINQIKKITCRSPVSSRGYSGYYYNVKLYSKDREVSAFTLMGEDTVVYGLYEKTGNFEYGAMYTANQEAENLLQQLNVLFENQTK